MEALRRSGKNAGIRTTITAVVMIASIATFAAEYSAEKADFSNGTEHTITFQDNTNGAALFVTCVDDTKTFYIQIYIDDVIFPDDLANNVMYLSVTHKFDTAESSHSGNWSMAMMKYHHAQFAGDESLFIKEAVAANRLAIKQDKAGAVYHFDIDEQARQYLKTAGQACGLL